MILRHLMAASLAMFIVLSVLQLWVIFAPVVVFMKASDWHSTRSFYISANISGYKINGCDLVKDSAVGWEKHDGRWFETRFNFVKDLTPGSSKPTSIFQRLDFGRWRWKVSNDKNPVRITLQHDCNGGVRTTTIGPFSHG